MSDHGDFTSESGSMEWEREVRGYNRQQVDNYVAWRAGQVRDLEGRLSQSLAEIERLRHELADARAKAARPPHEEISERVGQILKLAAEEAKAERERGGSDANATREAARAEAEHVRAEAQQEVDRLKTEAQERAERMLTAAQEQAERAVTTATSEAEQMVTSAKAAADKTVGDANAHAEKTVTTALSQAKQALDEATARATAIHDGAERRLNLLISRHTETVRRLTEIRDVVAGLVSGEVSRGSLEDEVNRALGLPQQAPNGARAAVGDGRNGQAETAISGPQRAPRELPAAEGRRAAETEGSRAAETEGRRAAGKATAAGQQPEPQAAVRGPAANGHDGDDPLAGSPSERNDGRHTAQDGSSSTSRHSTDAAMQAAEEHRQAAAAGQPAAAGRNQAPAEG